MIDLEKLHLCKCSKFDCRDRWLSCLGVALSLGLDHGLGKLPTTRDPVPGIPQTPHGVMVVAVPVLQTSTPITVVYAIRMW